MNLKAYFIIFSCLTISVPVFDAPLWGAAKKKVVKKKKSLPCKKEAVAQIDCEQPASKDGFSAPYALLIDAQTDTVLFENQPDAKMAPASMTKMLTAYIVMERLENGMLTEDTLFTVGKNAFRVEGSTSYLNINDQVKVIDLLKGLIVQSGNDASIVLAEGIAGTEQAFAELMNKKAQELGMVNSHFENANGLPSQNHLTTARDLVILAKRLREDFPKYYPLWGIKSYQHAGVEQMNRNPLLKYPQMGCDGIKTGHTQASGYGITATCEQNGRRLYAVVHGLKSDGKRREEIRNLMNYGFNLYNNYHLFAANHVVDHIPVWKGQKNLVKIGFKQSVILVTKKIDPKKDIKLEFDYPTTFKAPLQKGAEIGKLVITHPFGTKEVPLIVLEDIQEAGFVGRLYDGLIHLFGGRSYCDRQKKIIPLTQES
ncbi:MAG: D-alanyl-D-alanine carboxypeptidase DacC [Holosporales bacterium]